VVVVVVRAILIGTASICSPSRDGNAAFPHASKVRQRPAAFGITLAIPALGAAAGRIAGPHLIHLSRVAAVYPAFYISGGADAAGDAGRPALMTIGGGGTNNIPPVGALTAGGSLRAVAPGGIYAPVVGIAGGRRRLSGIRTPGATSLVVAAYLTAFGVADACRYETIRGIRAAQVAGVAGGAGDCLVMLPHVAEYACL